jgi:hypothetical protein
MVKAEPVNVSREMHRARRSCVSRPTCEHCGRRAAFLRSHFKTSDCGGGAGPVPFQSVAGEQSINVATLLPAPISLLGCLSDPPRKSRACAGHRSAACRAALDVCRSGDRFPLWPSQRRPHLRAWSTLIPRVLVAEAYGRSEADADGDLISVGEGAGGVNGISGSGRTTAHQRVPAMRGKLDRHRRGSFPSPDAARALTVEDLSS